MRVPGRYPAPLVGLLLALGVGGAASTGASALEPTPATHTGPWYQPGAPRVRSLRPPGRPGQSLLLRGRVLNTRGEPLVGALIELWHTDADGNYPPLRGSLESGRGGVFAVETIVPGHNLGYRARHIHFVISHPDHVRLVTRIFFHGDRNLAEAPFPELAVFTEESEVDGESRRYADLEFVLRPNR